MRGRVFAGAIPSLGRDGYITRSELNQTSSEILSMSHQPIDQPPQKKSSGLKYCLIGCFAAFLLGFGVVAAAGYLFYRGMNNPEPYAQAVMESIRDGDARTLYDESAEFFQSSATFEETESSLDDIRKDVGELIQWKRVAIKYETDEDRPKIAVITYRGTFESGERVILVSLEEQADRKPGYRLYRLDTFKTE